MDTSFINSVKTSLEELDNSFKTFSTSTFTEDVWYGKAALNAKELITDKIDTKITKLKGKLNSLENAIKYAKECDNYKSKIDTTKSTMASLDQNSENYASTYQSYNSTLSSYQNAYNEALSNLRSLDI